MRRVASLLALSLSTLAAVAGIPSGATGAPSCQNLRVESGLRAKLTAAHARPREGAISKGSIYYGRCGSTYYAIASFSKALADQPEKFRKLAGHGWVDKGDGFEDGCSAGARWPVPKALVALWHICRRFG
jgi:hypothetical protein